MRKGLCTLNVSLAAIVCLSGAVALANEKSSSMAPPAEQVSAQSQRDVRVQFAVEDHLRTDGRIDWEVLDVEVSEGRVTLYGEVETEEQKGLATDISSTVPGVTEVINRIIVNAPLSKNHLLQKAVWRTLRDVDVLQTDTLRVRAKDGVVTLSGMVEKELQKIAAGKAAGSVSGVAKVINGIHVGSLPFETEQDKLRKAGRERLR